jgi:hypothetical protein
MRILIVSLFTRSVFFSLRFSSAMNNSLHEVVVQLSNVFASNKFPEPVENIQALMSTGTQHRLLTLQYAPFPNSTVGIVANNISTSNNND